MKTTYYLVVEERGPRDRLGLAQVPRLLDDLTHAASRGKVATPLNGRAWPPPRVSALRPLLRLAAMVRCCLLLRAWIITTLESHGTSRAALAAGQRHTHTHTHTNTPPRRLESRTTTRGEREWRNARRGARASGEGGRGGITCGIPYHQQHLVGIVECDRHLRQ